jgi:hypothetical protein
MRKDSQIQAVMESMKASRGERRSGEAGRARPRVSATRAQRGTTRAQRGAAGVIAQYIQDLALPPRHAV